MLTILYVLGRCFLLPVMLGALASLPALLPPIRKWAKGRYARKLSISLIATLTVLAFFQVQSTFESASEYYSVGILTTTSLQNARKEKRDVVFKELWLRRITPPPFKQACYTQTDVCDLADQAVYRYTNGFLSDLSFQDEGWLDYLLFPTLAYLIPTAFGSLLIIFLAALRDDDIRQG